MIERPDPKDFVQYYDMDHIAFDYEGYEKAVIAWLTQTQSS